MTRLSPRTSASEYLAELEERQRADEEQVRRVMHKKYVRIGPLEPERTIFVRDLIRDAWREHQLLIIGGSLCGLAFVVFLLWGWPR